MQEKILMALNGRRATKEELYEDMLIIYPDMKMTTYLTEFYKLLKRGVIGRGDDGLYGLGVRTAKLLDWFGSTREPQGEENIGE